MPFARTCKLRGRMVISGGSAHTEKGILLDNVHDLGSLVHLEFVIKQQQRFMTHQTKRINSMKSFYSHDMHMQMRGIPYPILTKPEQTGKVTVMNYVYGPP